MVPKDRSSTIESALSRFRSGVEKVYSETRERSLGRMQQTDEEMSRKFSINIVQNSDTQELHKIGTENVTRFLNEENQNILAEAEKLDCYVIREQIKSSQSREEEEERVYRDEIDKLKRKNIELEQRIKQKKRLQDAVATTATSSTKHTHSFQKSTIKLPTLMQQQPKMNEIAPPLIMTGVSSTVKGLEDIFLPSETSTAAPEVQVIYEGKQRDLSRCLRKFAKKIFYL